MCLKEVQDFKNLKGLRFGYSVVLELIDRGGKGKTSKWECLCDCGSKHTKTSAFIRATINKNSKCVGSCNAKCGADLNKRKQIQENIVALEILAKGLEEKWGIEIGIGTLRQAQENDWKYYLTGDQCAKGLLMRRQLIVDNVYNVEVTKVGVRQQNTEVRNGEKIIRKLI